MTMNLTGRDIVPADGGFRAATIQPGNRFTVQTYERLKEKSDGTSEQLQWSLLKEYNRTVILA
jgi:hypothetical protein